LLILAAWLPALWNRSSAPYLLAALSAAVWLIFLVGVGRYEGPDKSAHRLTAGTFAVVYVGFLLSLAVQLRMEFGIGPLVCLLVVVKMGDIGAYTVGRLIGRHKMAPRISPGKTLEGAAGALLFAAVGSWASFTLLSVQGGIKCWLPFGLLIGVAGIFGDLAESLLKRDAGVKDSSRWLPGFGGVLDIIDSVLLASPLAWFCWEFWLNGH
jgi:phosphatidate cytidylyltransferase